MGAAVLAVRTPAAQRRDLPSVPVATTEREALRRAGAAGPALAAGGGA